MKKIAIICGSTEGMQKYALELLTETLLDITGEYPVCLPAERYAGGEFRCIYIGTRENNPFLRSLPGRPLTAPESFHILVKEDSIYIEGADDAGVLYGCADFYGRYIVPNENVSTSENHLVNVLALEECRTLSSLLPLPSGTGVSGPGAM